MAASTGDGVKTSSFYCFFFLVLPLFHSCQIFLSYLSCEEAVRTADSLAVWPAEKRGVVFWKRQKGKDKVCNSVWPQRGSGWLHNGSAGILTPVSFQYSTLTSCACHHCVEVGNVNAVVLWKTCTSVHPVSFQTSYNVKKKKKKGGQKGLSKISDGIRRE